MGCQVDDSDFCVLEDEMDSGTSYRDEIRCTFADIRVILQKGNTLTS